MIYGGLPQIVSFQSERQKADYLKNIFANVYLKDVIERNKIQNVDEIGILLMCLHLQSAHDQPFKDCQYLCQ